MVNVTSSDIHATKATEEADVYNIMIDFGTLEGCLIEALNIQYKVNNCVVPKALIVRCDC